jgi:phospholipid/cholesterol/gamma-HCH transport system ATP-binding protein
MKTSADSPSLIEVRHLVKHYDGRLVLDSFELSVGRGETCVIVGGSGSGKTTFARLLVGLERPDSGEIWVAGVDVARLRGRKLDILRRKFAVVFQGSALLDSINVFDNVAFPLREARRWTSNEIDERVHAALSELGVDEASMKLPGELSGGMAKRVGIARAIVTEPEILVYDEPTSGIDPVGSRVIDELIERMRALHAVTSIVITHDMVTAYDVADQIVLLRGGRAIASGSPDELFRSHGKELEPFLLASGIDVSRLGSRTARKSPAEIRLLWAATHAPAATASGGSA